MNFKGYKEIQTKAMAGWWGGQLDTEASIREYVKMENAPLKAMRGKIKVVKYKLHKKLLSKLPICLS